MRFARTHRVDRFVRQGEVKIIVKNIKISAGAPGRTPRGDDRSGHQLKRVPPAPREGL
jgi:hypothetical protein